MYIIFGITTHGDFKYERNLHEIFRTFSYFLIVKVVIFVSFNFPQQNHQNYINSKISNKPRSDEAQFATNRLIKTNVLVENAP